MRNPHARWLAVLVLALSASAMAAEPAAKPANPHRPVFALYMVCYGSTVEFYKQEIELAQRHGIDGFLLDCGAWGHWNAKKKQVDPSNYVISAERIYQAAEQLGTGFKLLMYPEYSVRPSQIMVGDMVRRFYKHPNSFRWNGKFVLGTYHGNEEIYAKTLQQLKQEGCDVLYLGTIGNERYMMGWSMESVLRFFRGQSHIDGTFFFLCDGVLSDLIRFNATIRRGTLFLDKLYMAGVSPTYNSPNLRDFRGMQGYGALWQGIIRDGADMAGIVTWNDYNEDSGLMPFRWPGGQEKDLFDRDESYLDVTAYYSAWYKTGVQPTITQDKLYFVYRQRSVHNQRAWEVDKKKWVDITAVPFPFDQIHDDALDQIYVTTFLTAPADLSVRVGPYTKTFAMPAGIHSQWLPLIPSVPRLTLERDGRVLADVVGRRLIIGEATKENSPYNRRQQHLLNRTWTNAAAVGPVVRLEAEAGKLHPNTSIVKQGDVSAVATTENDASGVTLPVKGLQTATYNVRITYSNRGINDARLTLIADGPPRAAKETPHFMPAFLPPTEGRFATTSVLWSLYDTTTFLQLEWQLGRGWGGKLVPDFNDRGAVLIDAVELVKVEPVTMPTPRTALWPELVHIPGGTFAMGSDDGAPDEQPRHKVTLSPFAIGKFEVTNEEYEKFEPTHRKYRDGYSWRDREPVLYVSWRHAALYCNGLSKQTGLTPVYDEKKWTVDPKADGFRLPTEAQWEYVASGRGEGRLYPWGDEKPGPKLGNFMLARSLEVNPDIRGSTGAGTMVVGTYPAGASRDGVMDLAGNVSEWCADWFNPYTADAQTDPLGQTPGNYRSIRGGSWGYYNFGQRVADREYNNPNYPGYIYLGFRVSLPEAGWKKLNP